MLPMGLPHPTHTSALIKSSTDLSRRKKASCRLLTMLKSKRLRDLALAGCGVAYSYCRFNHTAKGNSFLMRGIDCDADGFPALRYKVHMDLEVSATVLVVILLHCSPIMEDD